jgi:hypothetical protein
VDVVTISAVTRRQRRPHQRLNQPKLLPHHRGPSPSPSPLPDPYTDVENMNYAEQNQAGILSSSGGIGEPVRVGRIIMIVHGIAPAPNECGNAVEPGVALLDLDVEIQNVSATTTLQFERRDMSVTEQRAIPAPAARPTSTPPSW